MSGSDATETDVRTGHLAGADERTIPVLLIGFHDDPVHIGRRVELIDGDELVLGRGSDAFGAEALGGDRLSRRHAAFRRDGDAVVVEDLGSRNGTFVNGARVQTQRLVAHDVIEVGRVLLLFAHRPLLPRKAKSDYLVGVGSAHARLLASVTQVAAVDAPVLIRGETGVGKELVAAELHEQSGRSGNLVCVNCAALPDGVVHSELFGHARGAFSGASDERKGMVAEAAKGTLFLDEIGDASPSLQASLLRLLEQGEYRPVGSDRNRQCEARLVAATHVDLEAAVEANTFRRDLYARLERCVVAVPPLRERPEDIVVLALHFARVATGSEVGMRRSTALAMLRAPWPRNIRQLRAVVERAVRAHPPPEPLHLERDELERLTRAPVDDDPSDADAGEAAKPSAEHLRALLLQHDTNVSVVARELGVSRNTLYRWMSNMDIDLKQLRGTDQGR